MKKINLFVAVVMGGALLLPAIGQSGEYRRAHRQENRMSKLIYLGGTQDSAVCNPACPQGQICKWGKNNEAVCGKPDIVINCPGNDPLCGIEDTDTADRVGIYDGSTSGESAVCNPACPQGQICKWGKNNEAVCGEPDIVINCPDNDPLCGIDD